MNHSNNNNEGAVQPSTEATSASASINPNTNPTNTMKESDSMNASNITLVAGATVSGIVESKNQHGATLSIAGETAFLPVAQMGETSISDLAKGTELAVTVTDADGAKPRVAIASPDVTDQTPVETEDTVKAFEPTSDATVESDTADETAGDEDLSASIAKLAATWGASVRVESGTRKPSSKPSKKSVAPRKAVEAVVAKPVETPVVETVEVAEQPKVVETAPADSPKLAFLKTLKVGDEVKATVKFKKDFGAFMTVDKLGFGLLHVSEMPGTKPEQRKAYLDGLRYKQEVTAHVISVDLKEERLGLSLVAGEKTSFFRDLAVGSVVEGTVSGTKEIGAFVNLGVTTGFLHVSEVEGDNREQRDAKLASFSKGDKLELVVVDVNRDKQEVRLSQRRLALAALQPGDEVEGRFLHVRENYVVLDLSTGGRGYLPKQKGMPRFENGAVVTAKVHAVDVARGAVELV